MDQSITISAIIPTLGKRPEMLAEAIASLKAQTMPVHEIIVVDYVDDSFGNQARRINEGVKQSTGTHYFFMGDDDMLSPHFVARMTQEFSWHEWDIVTSRFEVFGDEIGEHGPGAFPLCSTVVSRAMYDKTAGYDETIPIGIDSDFYFQCFEHGATWIIIDPVLYRSRVHKQQYSKTGSWANYAELIDKKYRGKYSHL